MILLVAGAVLAIDLAPLLDADLLAGAAKDAVCVRSFPVVAAPLARSRRALTSIGARQENTGMAWSPDGTMVRAWGVPPIRIVPFIGDPSSPWTGWRISLDAGVKRPLILVETRP